MQESFNYLISIVSSISIIPATNHKTIKKFKERTKLVLTHQDEVGRKRDLFLFLFKVTILAESV